MGIFNSKQSIEKILEKIDRCVDSQIHVGSVFLNYKLQEKLLNEQKQYNEEQLRWSRFLSIATAILAIATVVLIFVSK